MKHTLRNILVLATILAFGSLFLMPKSHLNTFEELPKPAIAVEAPAKPSIPVELAIESIGVIAPVTSVGILGKSMAVPTNDIDVGWYNLGVRPGDVGSAVLAGHVNWYGGQDAVFTNLHLVQIGDTIIVRDDQGRYHYFMVRDIKRYPIHADASEVFNSDDGLAHLNLVTCDGPWNSLIKTHEMRLVVFADKVE